MNRCARHRPRAVPPGVDSAAASPLAARSAAARSVAAQRQMVRAALVRRRRRAGGRWRRWRAPTDSGRGAGADSGPDRTVPAAGSASAAPATPAGRIRPRPSPSAAPDADDHEPAAIRRCTAPPRHAAEHGRTRRAHPGGDRRDRRAAAAAPTQGPETAEPGRPRRSRRLVTSRASLRHCRRSAHVRDSVSAGTRRLRPIAHPHRSRRRARRSSRPAVRTSRAVQTSRAVRTSRAVHTSSPGRPNRAVRISHGRSEPARADRRRRSALPRRRPGRRPAGPTTGARGPAPSRRRRTARGRRAYRSHPPRPPSRRPRRYRLVPACRPAVREHRHRPGPGDHRPAAPWRRRLRPQGPAAPTMPSGPMGGAPISPAGPASPPGTRQTSGPGSGMPPGPPMQSGPAGPRMPPGGRRVTAAMPGQVDRGPSGRSRRSQHRRSRRSASTASRCRRTGSMTPFAEVAPQARGSRHPAGSAPPTWCTRRPSTGVRVLVGAVVLVLLVLIPGILVLSAQWRQSGGRPAELALAAVLGRTARPGPRQRQPLVPGSCMVTERTWDSDTVRRRDRGGLRRARCVRPAGPRRRPAQGLRRRADMLGAEPERAGSDGRHVGVRARHAAAEPDHRRSAGRCRRPNRRPGAHRPRCTPRSRTRPTSRLVAQIGRDLPRSLAGCGGRQTASGAVDLSRFRRGARTDQADASHRLPLASPHQDRQDTAESGAL